MTRLRIPTLVVALLVVFFTGTTEAQSGATLAGTIADGNGAVVINADVQLLSMASGRTFQTKSNAAGKYELTELPLGSYRASVTSEGFAMATRDITLRRVATYFENFILVPGVIESNITVTAAKGNARAAAETAQVVTIFDSSQIEERRPSSTLQAIERAPNLTPVLANPAL